MKLEFGRAYTVDAAFTGRYDLREVKIPIRFEITPEDEQLVTALLIARERELQEGRLP